MATGECRPTEKTQYCTQWVSKLTQNL